MTFPSEVSMAFSVNGVERGLRGLFIGVAFLVAHYQSNPKASREQRMPAMNQPANPSHCLVKAIHNIAITQIIAKTENTSYLFMIQI